MTDLDPFPVDDSTLALIDLALDTALTDQSSLYNLLDLLSGYDPDKLTPVYDDRGIPRPDVVEYPHPIYSPHDVIRALIDEVRRLRTTP